MRGESVVSRLFHFIFSSVLWECRRRLDVATLDRVCGVKGRAHGGGRESGKRRSNVTHQKAMLERKGELTSSLVGEKLKGRTDGRTVTTEAAAAARISTTRHRFPFDEQACLFRFSSWTYDSNKLNLTLRPNAVNREGYMLNGVSLYTSVALILRDSWTNLLKCRDRFPCTQEWDLRGFDSERKPILYEGTPYVELHFTLHIRRRTLYYFSNLILPCVIIGRARSSICLTSRRHIRQRFPLSIIQSIFLALGQLRWRSSDSASRPSRGRRSRWRSPC